MRVQLTSNIGAGSSWRVDPRLSPTNPRLEAEVAAGGTTLTIKSDYATYASHWWPNATPVDVELTATQAGANVELLASCDHGSVSWTWTGGSIIGAHVPAITGMANGAAGTGATIIEWNNLPRTYEWADWRDWYPNGIAYVVAGRVVSCPAALSWLPRLGGPTILRAAAGQPVWKWDPTRDGSHGLQLNCTVDGVAAPALNMTWAGWIASMIAYGGVASWETDDGYVFLAAAALDSGGTYRGRLRRVNPGSGSFSEVVFMDGMYPAATRLLPSNDVALAYVDSGGSIVALTLAYVPSAASYLAGATVDTGFDGMMCGAVWLDDTGRLWIEYTDLSGSAQTIHSDDGGATWP